MNKILHKILQGFFFLGFLGIVVTGVMVSYPKYRHARGLAEERARIQRKIDDKLREITELKAMQQRFNTDREFVETLARRNRLVFPGELVFVFDD